LSDRCGDRRGLRAARRALLPVAVMLAIAAGSLRPLPAGLRAGPDKLVHAGVWAVLAAGWSWALGPLAAPGPRIAGVAFGLSGAWGGCDELIQARVPWRDADPLDLAADLAGAAAGALGWLWYRRLRSAGGPPGPGAAGGC